MFRLYQDTEQGQGVRHHSIMNDLFNPCLPIGQTVPMLHYEWFIQVFILHPLPSHS